MALLMAVLLSAAPVYGQPATFDLQAHRGGRGETTEESLRAFAKAIQTGVSTLELDIIVTRDGQPLVWHDPTIQADKCSDTGPAFPSDPGYPYVGKLVHQLT
ncbi:glycerophosphodiester phosphodiesterase family protein, partial [Mycobacterium avium]